ncbi:MAG TPA: LuxR C-terminal-related transcriptional regulator [Solirubrobacterales bacterium]
MVDVSDQLRRGRESFDGRAWLDAYESLSGADRADPLDAEDLELLATAAYMVGVEEDYFSALERGYRAHLDAGEGLRAARCAFWVGVNFARRGEVGKASGWLGRAERLVEREDDDCAERSYLLLPVAFQHEASGDWEAAADALGEAVEAGERFDDRDLFALAVHEQGHALIEHGRVGEGVRLLDEAMVAVTAGELSPIVTGLVYCGVILACQRAYEPQRAQEWTTALTGWCEEQPDMVSFTGRCLTHRAELMQLRGAWAQALEEARRAGDRFSRQRSEAAVGEALYRQGEIHRLLGRFGAAEEAYRDASRRGWEPQPGLALLRLAQGRGDDAAGAIRRAMDEAGDGPKRIDLLPAYVEIMLAAGDASAARRACEELEGLAAGQRTAMFEAIVASARGAVDLHEGDATNALAALRRAQEGWRELDAPYEAAMVRRLAGLACRALGDEEGAALELEAAREALAELGASPEVARIDALLGRAGDRESHGLTTREVEVLRMVAAGDTNKAIAAELVLSERTVDRHVSNIYGKLGVSSRAAATAYAYEHRLI